MRHLRALAFTLSIVPPCLGCSKEGRVEVVSAPAPAPRRESSETRPAAGPAPSRSPARIDAATVDVLKQALESKDYATRLIAIEAIGETRAEMFLPWLERSLGDPEHDVRMATVDALQRFRSTRSLTLLLSVRDDTTEELDIRALAASALLASTP
jgi:HEAT repeat protein